MESAEVDPIRGINVVKRWVRKTGIPLGICIPPLPAAIKANHLPLLAVRTHYKRLGAFLMRYAAFPEKERVTTVYTSEELLARVERELHFILSLRALYIYLNTNNANALNWKQALRAWIAGADNPDEFEADLERAQDPMLLDSWKDWLSIRTFRSWRIEQDLPWFPPFDSGWFTIKARRLQNEGELDESSYLAWPYHSARFIWRLSFTIQHIEGHDRHPFWVPFLTFLKEALSSLTELMFEEMDSTTVTSMNKEEAGRQTYLRLQGIMSRFPALHRKLRVEQSMSYAGLKALAIQDTKSPVFRFLRDKKDAFAVVKQFLALRGFREFTIGDNVLKWDAARPSDFYPVEVPAVVEAPQRAEVDKTTGDLTYLKPMKKKEKAYPGQASFSLLKAKKKKERPTLDPDERPLAKDDNALIIVTEDEEMQAGSKRARDDDNVMPTPKRARYQQTRSDHLEWNFRELFLRDQERGLSEDDEALQDFAQCLASLQGLAARPMTRAWRDKVDDFHRALVDLPERGGHREERYDPMPIEPALGTLPFIDEHLASERAVVVFEFTLDSDAWIFKLNVDLRSLYSDALLYAFIDMAHAQSNFIRHTSSSQISNYYFAVVVRDVMHLQGLFRLGRPILRLLDTQTHQNALAIGQSLPKRHVLQLLPLLSSAQEDRSITVLFSLDEGGDGMELPSIALDGSLLWPLRGDVMDMSAALKATTEHPCSGKNCHRTVSASNVAALLRLWWISPVSKRYWCYDCAMDEKERKKKKKKEKM